MNNKNILIIGGTGSFGKGLIKELLKKEVSSIKVFARNEFRMFSMIQQFESGKIEIVIGDIRDKEAISKASQGIDIVFHLAALKHVPICEKMPNEVIATNILGTKHVIDAAIENNVQKVIFSSTDKAVNPDCTYGTSKLMGEKLILSANAQQTATKFIVFRGGNLLNSAGSVIPIFNKQISETSQVTLTDDKMNRFFVSIATAAKMLIEIAEKAAGNEIFIPKMPSVKIEYIAKYLLTKNHLSNSNISIIGLRPGEKISEQIISENERQNLFEFSEELYVILKDDAHSWQANKVVKALDSVHCTSNEDILTYDQTAQFLEVAGI